MNRGQIASSLEQVAPAAHPSDNTVAGRTAFVGSGDKARRSGRAIILAVGVALSCSVVAGCSQSINVETLEQELISQIAVQRGVGVSTVTVTCPSPVEVTEGSVVDCPAVVDGQPFTVTVTQTDGEGAMQWVINPDEPDEAPAPDATVDSEGTSTTG